MNIKHFITNYKLNNSVIVDELLQRTKSLEPDKCYFKIQLTNYYMHDIGQVI